MNNDKAKEEQQIVDKAKEVAIQYFKETKNLDITVTKVKFGPSDFGVIFVSGYETGNQNRKVTADINYRDNYRVESISYDD
ncbi:hypothetical protein [Bacillus cereus group sp. BfR-BA-01380]|uniref:hypothetical protein n=1 Tax=Bacillus cereus group sp. BfR-BA-01380 TaxID=2920324 RepID=UPI0028BEBDFF|nr:hypothetical protein [Bacillus cereus group sp. BfR-BA-01380]